MARAVCATTAITAPSAPKRRAMLAPIPREPPVTIATLPSSLMPCLRPFEAGTIAREVGSASRVRRVPHATDYCASSIFISS